MKKLIKIIVFMLVLLNINVNGVQANTTVYVNEETTVPVTVNFSKPIVGFYETSTGVSGTIGDPMKSEYVKSATINVKIAPKVLGDYKFTISFDVADSDANDIATPTKSVTVKVINRPAPKSSNNFLASLSTTAGTINFNKNTSNYTLIVNNNVTSATINATAEDSKATVSGIGTKNLKIYSNNFPIRVTAENGTVRTYGVNIVRRDADGNAGALSQNNNLASLSAEGCDIDFKKDVLEYRCEVDSLVDNVVVIANAEDPKASVDISQLSVLSIGNNEIHIRVMAENEDVKLYKLIINRSGDAPLIYEMDLRKALETHSGEEISIYETGRLALDSLKLIQKKRKTLLVKSFDDDDNLMYIWRFEGNEVDALVDIATHIEFDGETKTQVDDLTNYTAGLLLSFQYNPHLPQGTTVGIYVGNRFDDGQEVNVYYYDQVDQTLELKFQHFVVKDGFVWLPLEHTSDYFVTPALIDNNISKGDELWKYTTFGLGALVVILLGLLVKIRIGTKNKKELKKDTL